MTSKGDSAGHQCCGPHARDNFQVDAAHRLRWRYFAVRGTHGYWFLPCFSCCFQPRMRAFAASASASGTIPLRW